MVLVSSFSFSISLKKGLQKPSPPHPIVKQIRLHRRKVALTALQHVEMNGLVDYTLGGHKCERPPEVKQGKCDDRFDIQGDPDSPLLWKANNVAMKNLKSNNVASHFTWEKLSNSNLDLVS